MNELTATRSIRFVVALYWTLKTNFSPAPSAAVTLEKVRRTSGDSSSSTVMALTAMEDSRAVGKGTSICLCVWKRTRRSAPDRDKIETFVGTYSEQGKSRASTLGAILPGKQRPTSREGYIRVAELCWNVQGYFRYGSVSLGWLTVV